jgi:hypothetical protein
MKLIILIIIILVFFKFINLDYFTFKSVNNKDDRFITTYDNFLNEKQCKYLSNFIINHKLNNKNNLSELFDSSYGILVKFRDNLDHYKKFKENNLSPIYELFKRVKDPNCNAFVFNILVIKANSKTKNGIGVHYDNTLSIKTGLLKRFILPKWVSVIYLNLPKNFKGGSIMINNFRNYNFYCPKAKIQPKVGKYIKFQGDSSHIVNDIDSDEADYRISIIFEQYIIDDKVSIPFSIY